MTGVCGDRMGEPTHDAKEHAMVTVTDADVVFDELPPTIARIAGDHLPQDPATAPVVRWGIIGAGNIAHKFVTDARRANAEFVAVGSASPERAAKFAAEENIPFHGTYEEVVGRDDVDAIYVATTHNFHLENTLLALKAGKHVLIEKPITVTPAELAQLREAAKEAGVLVMEAMWSRFLPLYRIVRAIVESGELGDITYVRAEHNQCLRGIERMEKAELAGGATLDLGVYSASFIHWVLGVPQSITAAGHLTDAGVDIDAVAILDYPGATAVYETSMGNRTATAATVAGSRGFIELPEQFYRPSSIRLVLNEEEGRQGVDETWSIEKISNFGFEYQAAAFARGIEAGLTEIPEHTLSDAAEVMDILHEVRTAIGIQAG